METKKERTAWRDEWISLRHRDFGWDCPMVDLDDLETPAGSVIDQFKTMEYDNSIPVALIEYKHYNAKITLSHPSIQAQKYLADCAKIPFMVVIYYPETHHFYVIPMNDIAKEKHEWLASERMWNERNYVHMLYWLRKRPYPKEISDKMWNLKDPINPKMTILGR